jgi:putative transposase
MLKHASPTRLNCSSGWRCRGWQARDPDLSTTSTRRTVPKMDSAASALAPPLDGSTAVELIPELVRHGLHQLIELEVAAVLDAERSEERLGHRNGYRLCVLTTQVGDIDLQMPKLRLGSFLPLILEPRRRVDWALYAAL